MKKHDFTPVTAHADFPRLEEKIITYWKKNTIFEKSIASRPANKTWTFLDGPPFITGLPHYGTLLSSIPKDVFPRFWTMKGYRVRRVWGWDCHGLPAENKVEEKLGIKRKKDIEETIGVKRFIDECKRYVGEVSSEWGWYVDHIGRWVDFRNAYKTMDLPYMESVLWVFRQLYDRGYIYKGVRVSLYCPHCATPISNFEVAMDADNYKEITEPAATYMYQLKDTPDTFLLAWSTTPWNKLATAALAVNPKLTYVKVKQGDVFYILAKDTTKMLSGEYKVVEEFKGKELVGKKFVPHYDYYPIEKGKKAFVVVAGDFVTASEGTGIVTIAAYGEEDLAVMRSENIQLVLHVDEEGMLTKEVPKWAGMYYLDVDPLVIEDLRARNLIYRVDSYTHTVPTCWRCHTRLIYAPQDAWYVDVQRLKPKMKETNEKVRWYPDHFKYGRFLKSMEQAPDWCISRSRYWGSPVPVWECTCGTRYVPGSIAELETLSGSKITDLHKPEIDDVTIRCSVCGKTARRVPEVLDSWIEAGSAPYAERHYPFDTRLNLSDFFPTDFIAEYTGQIRAWFYVLHVIATALFDSHAFKNVLVTGVILGTDGRKMSKNYGNYPDPKEMLEKYGGDALRLYLLGSPVMNGEDIRISEEQYRSQVRGLMLTVWNVYNFFVMYANADGWTRTTKHATHKPGEHVLDRWITRLLAKLTRDVTDGLEAYNTVSCIRALEAFIEDLSTWYVRRSRDRVGPTAADGNDKDNCYATLSTVLATLCKLLAPFTPFLAEEMYRNITGEKSVHVSEWPTREIRQIDTNLFSAMNIVRKYVEAGHAMRKKLGIRLRQPLASLWLFSEEAKEKKWWGEFEGLLKDELNVKKIEHHRYSEVAHDDKRLKTTCLDPKYGVSALFYLDVEITPELRREGEARELIRRVQLLRKEKGRRIDERIVLQLPSQYTSLGEDLVNVVRQQTLAKEVLWGDSLAILTG